MISDKEQRNTNGPDPIETLIMQASAKEYGQAKDFFRLITSGFAAPVLSDAIVGTDAEAQKQAWKALSGSVRGDPRWTSSFLVIALVLARSSADRFDPEEVRDALQWYAEENLSS
jgi:hypothetical protein